MIEAGTITIKVTPEGLKEALRLIEQLAAAAARINEAIEDADVKVGSATVAPSGSKD